MTASEIVSLLQDLRTPEFPSALARAFDRQCLHRFLLVLQVEAGAPPRLLFAQAGPGRAIGSYDFPDPVTTAMGQECAQLFDAGPDRAYCLEALAGRGLLATGLYRHYLASLAPADLCLFPARITQRRDVILAVGRSRPAAPYTRQEMDRYVGSAATLCALLRTQWEPVCVFPASRPSGFPDHNIDSAVTAFAPALTGREREVIRLIFRGYSSKAVAREMNIAVKTEKVHRRNAYAKLGVSSQAELFASFLSFLASGQAQHRDPQPAVLRPVAADAAPRWAAGA